jgi:sulfatase maturation enzyme AslB (radical SAM superfamily)
MYGSTGIVLWIGIGRNGIARGMRKLEWHISKFSFCNNISPIDEYYNGIDPINPFHYRKYDDKSFSTLVNIMCLVHPTCPSGSLVSANTSLFPCHNFNVSKATIIGTSISYTITSRKKHS